MAPEMGAGDEEEPPMPPLKETQKAGLASKGQKGKGTFTAKGAATGGAAGAACTTTVYPLWGGYAGTPFPSQELYTTVGAAGGAGGTGDADGVGGTSGPARAYGAFVAGWPSGNAYASGASKSANTLSTPTTAIFNESSTPRGASAGFSSGAGGSCGIVSTLAISSAGTIRTSGGAGNGATAVSSCVAAWITGTGQIMTITCGVPTVSANSCGGPGGASIASAAATAANMTSSQINYTAGAGGAGGDGLVIIGYQG